MSAKRHASLLALLVLALASALPAAAAERLRINGSTTVNPVVSRAAEVLRREEGMTILVDTQGGSSGGIAALGEGRIEVGMSSRPLHPADHEKYPGVRFHATRIATDALALVVSRDVWDGGVKALTREQIQAIYEGRIKNWRQVGGPDQRVVFFNKEPGRGTWEVFVDWLYGGADEAPFVSHPEVGSNEEGRTKVGSTKGAVSQLSAAWADGKRVMALGIRLDDGTVARPDEKALEDGSYPLARPLLLLTDGAPPGAAAVLVDFLLSPRGQAIAREVGYLPVRPAEGPGGAP